ncbi:MAG: hypothetical protein ACLTSZ_14530 [Lachnospiraceae bacterium]
MEHLRAFAQEHADHDVAAWGAQEELCGQKDGILILGDQIIANSLRAEIYYVTGKCSCVGLPFGAQAESLEQAIDTENEEQIQKQSMIPRLLS